MDSGVKTCHFGNFRSWWRLQNLWTWTGVQWYTSTHNTWVLCTGQTLASVFLWYCLWWVDGSIQPWCSCRNHQLLQVGCARAAYTGLHVLPRLHRLWMPILFILHLVRAVNLHNAAWPPPPCGSSRELVYCDSLLQYIQSPLFCVIPDPLCVLLSELSQSFYEVR